MTTIRSLSSACSGTPNGSLKSMRSRARCTTLSERPLGRVRHAARLFDAAKDGQPQPIVIPDVRIAHTDPKSIVQLSAATPAAGTPEAPGLRERYEAARAAISGSLRF